MSLPYPLVLLRLRVDPGLAKSPQRCLIELQLAAVGGRTAAATSSRRSP